MVEDREKNDDNEKNKLEKITCQKEENKNEMEMSLEDIFQVRMKNGEMRGRKKKRGKLDFLIRDHNA